MKFQTNKGSALSNITKASGTKIDLSQYKSERGGYNFNGWYSNEELTEKVTSISLLKDTTVYAKWTEEEKQIENPFKDISEKDYYYDAVLWAVGNTITSGTTSSTFSPNMICTRAQMVTLLWRATGSPEPINTSCQFTDIDKNAYYYKAVLWAAENDFAIGTSLTTFSPELTVTRGQAATFMWRTEGKVKALTENPYIDVDKSYYYYDAILWAVENGITQGTSPTRFSPIAGCTRAQIVTFLYRYRRYL